MWKEGGEERGWAIQEPPRKEAESGVRGFGCSLRPGCGHMGAEATTIVTVLVPCYSLWGLTSHSEVLGTGGE